MINDKRGGCQAASAKTSEKSWRPPADGMVMYVPPASPMPAVDVHSILLFMVINLVLQGVKIFLEAVPPSWYASDRTRALGRGRLNAKGMGRRELRDEEDI